MGVGDFAALGTRTEIDSKEDKGFSRRRRARRTEKRLDIEMGVRAGAIGYWG
jgi:hypothetical protein